MTDFALPSSRLALFRELEGYVSERAEELFGKRLTHELVKSYLLETSQEGVGSEELSTALAESRWILEPIDEDLFLVRSKEPLTAYLEQLDRRYFIVYTTARSEVADAALNRLISRSSLLDRLWFSGILLHALWSQIATSHDPRRFVRMRFEFDDLFGLLGPDEPVESEMDIARALERAPERRGSVFALTERIGRARSRLPDFRRIEEAFDDMTLLRLPSVGGRGGHELYYTGKVTNRSDSFMEHRSQLLYLVATYREMTQRVERRAWLSFSSVDRETTRGMRLDGMPITFKFSAPLSREVLDNFVRVTLEQGRGPFRILGKPVHVGPDSLHVYGVDMHLWQEIWLDVTLSHWTLVLPRGTCGNTINRFMANIQRYIDPRVSVLIGQTPIQELIADSLARASS